MVHSTQFTTASYSTANGVLKVWWQRVVRGETLTGNVAATGRRRRRFASTLSRSPCDA